MARKWFSGGWIEGRIKRKEQQIQETEAQTREAQAYIQALQDVLKILLRDTEADVGTALRPGNAIAQARDAILEAGRPVHISALLAAMGREMTRNTRALLSGSLATYVRRREIFTRPEPNTFGLIDTEEAPEPTLDEPPETFGSVMLKKARQTTFRSK